MRECRARRLVAGGRKSHPETMLQIVDNDANMRLHSNRAGRPGTLGGNAQWLEAHRKETTYVQQSGRDLALPALSGERGEVVRSRFPLRPDGFASDWLVCAGVSGSRADLPDEAVLAGSPGSSKAGVRNALTGIPSSPAALNHSRSKSGVTASGAKQGTGEPRNPFGSRVTMQSQPAERPAAAVTASSKSENGNCSAS
jgi:hypothetical protein